VEVYSKPINHQGVANQVHELSSRILRVSPAKKHRVIQRTVDRLDIVAPPVDPFENRQNSVV
jgi:hypothetical protein